MIQATQEAFCSQEVAKLLEEKGFIKDCARIHAHCNPYDPYFIVDILIAPNTPTHQTAMRWLREVKNIHLSIIHSNVNNRGYWFAWSNEFGFYESDESYKTYEEATEAALKYALEVLI